jgi:predicted alpha/beta superfamily hydrolase
MAAYPKVLVPLSILVFFSCGNTPVAFSLKTERTTLQSTYVKDSFDIYVTLPSTYDESKKNFPVIFYLDANLKSGNTLRVIVDDFSKKQRPIPAVFIGVGHFGNYHVLRRRDLITPYAKDKNDSLISEDPNFGQTKNFYLFMQNELIPYVERNYRVTTNRTLVGHSLGGLFTFYCLFQKERMFTKFVALSPALWINDGNIYDFEEKYRRDSAVLHASLFLCVGGAERFNYILSGARKMKAYLAKNPFEGLHLEYYEFPGETHNSEVSLALEKVLPLLKSQ